MEIDNELSITESSLIRAGFKKKEGGAFKNNQLPYWAKDGIVLMFNETDEKNYLMGVGQSSYNDEYFVATFYWVSTFHPVKKLYSLYTNSCLKF